MSFPPVEKTVLITGCSTGIGAATAVVLRDNGWRVIPTARKEDDLAALRNDGFAPVQLDVADSVSVQRAADEALEMADGKLGALVNNAGFGQPGAMEDISRDALRYQFEVNVFGMQELTNRCIPVFRQQGRGRIVNISSVVGRISLPFLGSYSATKFAMEAISDSLRVELRDTGLAVSLVEPGPIATSFGLNATTKAGEHLDVEHGRFADVYRHAVARERRMSGAATDIFRKPPQAVAQKILHALTSARPRRRYCVTVPAYFGAFLSRFVPDGIVDAMLSMGWKKNVGSA